MRTETAGLQESDTCVAVVITTLEAARAALAVLGKAAPTGAVRGLDIAISALDPPHGAMSQVVDDLKVRASHLQREDWYRRQCAHALTVAAALIEIFLEGE